MKIINNETDHQQIIHKKYMYIGGLTFAFVCICFSLFLSTSPLFCGRCEKSPSFEKKTSRRPGHIAEAGFLLIAPLTVATLGVE